MRCWYGGLWRVEGESIFSEHMFYVSLDGNFSGKHVEKLREARRRWAVGQFQRAPKKQKTPPCCSERLLSERLLSRLRATAVRPT